MASWICLIFLPRLVGNSVGGWFQFNEKFRCAHRRRSISCLPKVTQAEMGGLVPLLNSGIAGLFAGSIRDL